MSCSITSSCHDRLIWQLVLEGYTYSRSQRAHWSLLLWTSSGWNIGGALQRLPQINGGRSYLFHIFSNYISRNLFLGLMGAVHTSSNYVFGIGLRPINTERTLRTFLFSLWRIYWWIRRRFIRWYRTL